VHTSGGNVQVRNGYAPGTPHQDGGFAEVAFKIGGTQPVRQRSWTAAGLTLGQENGPPPPRRGPFRSAAAILAGAGIAAAAPTLAGAGGLGVVGLRHGRSPSLALWRLALWRITF